MHEEVNELCHVLKLTVPNLDPVAQPDTCPIFNGNFGLIPMGGMTWYRPVDPPETQVTLELSADTTYTYTSRPFELIHRIERLTLTESGYTLILERNHSDNKLYIAAGSNTGDLCCNFATPALVIVLSYVPVRYVLSASTPLEPDYTSVLSGFGPAPNCTTLNNTFISSDPSSPVQWTLVADNVYILSFTQDTVSGAAAQVNCRRQTSVAPTLPLSRLLPFTGIIYEASPAILAAFAATVEFTSIHYLWYLLASARSDASVALDRSGFTFDGANSAGCTTVGTWDSLTES